MGCLLCHHVLGFTPAYTFSGALPWVGLSWSLACHSHPAGLPSHRLMRWSWFSNYLNFLGATRQSHSGQCLCLGAHSHPSWYHSFHGASYSRSSGWVPSQCLVLVTTKWYHSGPWWAEGNGDTVWALPLYTNFVPTFAWEAWVLIHIPALSPGSSINFSYNAQVLFICSRLGGTTVVTVWVRSFCIPYHLIHLSHILRPEPISPLDHSRPFPMMIWFPKFVVPLSS